MTCHKKKHTNFNNKIIEKDLLYEFCLCLLPEEANLFRKRNTQVLRNGNNSVFERNTVDDVVGEVLCDLKRERSIANHKLPYLLPPGIKNRPRAEVQLPLFYALCVGFRIEITQLRGWIIIFHHFSFFLCNGQ